MWTAGSNPGERDDATAEMLLKYDPDFICLQEFDPLYRNAENGLIGQISSQYTEVSINDKDVNDVDGDNDKDEVIIKDAVWNPIFFDHSKYTQVTSGYVWFKAVDGLKALSYEPTYTDGKLCHARSLVWAVLQDAEGDLFLVANTHFTMKEGLTLEDKAPIHTAEATFVANTLKNIADGYEDITVLVGGDMNSVISNENCGVDTMLKNGFTHTYNLASAKNNLESYHGETAPSTGYLEYAIDHILTLNADLNVRSFYVLNDAALYSVSDHLPVKMSFYK